MSAGKGDSLRPVDGGKYRVNYDAIFRRVGKRNGKNGKDKKS